MRFKSTSEHHLRTRIAGVIYEVAPGAECEIPDDVAFAVKRMGLPLVEWSPPAAAPPPPPRQPAVRNVIHVETTVPPQTLVEEIRGFATGMPADAFTVEPIADTTDAGTDELEEAAAEADKASSQPIRRRKK